MWPLIPLFWTSGDACPGLQCQGEFPGLYATSPACNLFAVTYLSIVNLSQTCIMDNVFVQSFVPTVKSYSQKPQHNRVYWAIVITRFTIISGYMVENIKSPYWSRHKVVHFCVLRLSWNYRHKQTPPTLCKHAGQYTSCHAWENSCTFAATGKLDQILLFLPLRSFMVYDF